MVAIQITDEGPEIDPLGKIDVHPAANLFPEMSEVEFRALCRDIRKNGQLQPVTVSERGELIDGRARWRACAKVGIRPVTRRARDEPWAVALQLNADTKGLGESQKAMIGARVPKRPPGRSGATQHGVPPSISQIARLLGVARTGVQKAIHVLERGTLALQQAVDDDLISVYTGARLANSLDAAGQDEFIQRVRDGASVRLLFAAMDVDLQQSSATRPALATNHSTRRHRYVGIPALRATATALDALETVLRGADGIDPHLSKEEAAEWYGDLFKKRVALSRVITQLKERKDLK